MSPLNFKKIVLSGSPGGNSRLEILPPDIRVMSEGPRSRIVAVSSPQDLGPTQRFAIPYSLMGTVMEIALLPGKQAMLFRVKADEPVGVDCLLPQQRISSMRVMYAIDNRRTARQLHEPFSWDSLMAQIRRGVQQMLDGTAAQWLGNNPMPSPVRQHGVLHSAKLVHHHNHTTWSLIHVIGNATVVWLDSAPSIIDLEDSGQVLGLIMPPNATPPVYHYQVKCDAHPFPIGVAICGSIAMVREHTSVTRHPRAPRLHQSIHA